MVSGSIVDENGKALPFANVQVLPDGWGSASNLDGYYELDLPAGKYELIYTYIGYKSQRKSIQLDQDLVLDISLELETLELDQVTIKGDEDPAMEIMRKVIAQKDSIKQDLNRYSTDVYIKSLQALDSAPDKILGFNLGSLGVLDSNNSGILYLSESESKLYFEAPNKTKEIMYSSKVSGDSDDFSFNEATSIHQIDLNDNRVDMGISERSFVSPLANDAFFFYRYRLIGTYYEQHGEDSWLINKIEVIPRRKNDPAFRGYLFVVEDLWRINASDLLLTKESGLEIVDSLQLQSSFEPLITDTNRSDLQDHIKYGPWISKQKSFRFRFALLGLKGHGYYLAHYQNYEVPSQPYPKGFFGPEIIRIEEGANKRDSLYWQSARPIPLSSEEIQDYEKKDSLEALRESEVYLDSLDKIANQFSPLDILFGYEWQDSYNKTRWSVDAPLSLIGFNTVEGYHLGLGLNYRKGLSRARTLDARTDFRYGIGNQRWGAVASLRFIERKHFTRWTISGGRSVAAFDPESISTLLNSLYSLFLEENYLKLYGLGHAEIRWSREVTRGLRVYSTLAWEDRSPLENTALNPWVNRSNREFTSNNPQNVAGQDLFFEKHQAAILKLRIRYRPGQKYISEPDRRYNIPSNWPSFSLALRTAQPWAGTDLEFTELSAQIEANQNLGLIGELQLLLKGGHFINQDSLGFMDFHHFHGNQTFYQEPRLDRFFMADYYALSTSNSWAEIHAEHHFNGFLFNKIPGLRKTKIQTVVGTHQAFQERGWYGELTVGLEHIFKVLRVDFVLAFDDGDVDPGFRFGFGF